MPSDGIFDSPEVAENIEESAEALGIDREKVKIDGPRKVVVAKSNCKKCFGRGYLDFMPVGSDEFTVLQCRCLRIKEIF